MKPENLLIVSDLHLGEGWLVDKQAFAAREDFLFDRQFAAFLRHYTTTEPWLNRQWKLIINGDFMDFLQVNTVTGAPPDLKGLTDPYGLDCGRRETVWKLRKIHEGHPVFFQALADFAWRYPLVIIKGNHDVEFTFEEVQQEFIRLLADYLDETGPDTQGHAPAHDVRKTRERRLAAQVSFCEWIYYEPQRIYVEHGNQYEATNSFRFVMDPRVPVGYHRKSMADEVELPLGSLFIRYIFNRMETEQPNMDNVKPAEEFIKWYVHNSPAQLLGLIFREGRLIVRHLQRMTQVVKHRGFLQRKQSHEMRLNHLAGKLALDESLLRWIDALKADPVLYRPGRTWELLLRMLRLQIAYPLLTFWLICLLALVAGTSFLVLAPVVYAVASWLFRGLPLWFPSAWLGVLLALDAFFLLPCAWAVIAVLRQFQGRDPTVDKLRRVSRRIAQRLQVPLVTMGHTHHAELRHYKSDSIIYVNTGTWTNVFDFQRPDEVEHQMNYLRVLRDPPEETGGMPRQRAELLSWKQ